jgi:hypothetical protein
MLENPIKVSFSIDQTLGMGVSGQAAPNALNSPVYTDLRDTVLGYHDQKLMRYAAIKSSKFLIRTPFSNSCHGG